MEQRAGTPKTHTGGHPARHAIFAAQSGTHGLQGDKEGEEESQRGVEIAWGEAGIFCEACDY